MIYTVRGYMNGQLNTENITVAKSHKNALLPRSYYGRFDVIYVQGKTVKWFKPRKKGFVEVKGEVTLYKVNASKPCIVMTIGDRAIAFRYQNREVRDQVFQEATCTESQSAESAKSDPEPTGITALSSEIYGSKNTSTSKKISNGFATNVTWLEKLTHSSIDVPSGGVSAEDMESEECERGSRRSRSGSRQKTLLVTVKIPEADLSYAPDNLKAINGMTIRGKKSPIGGLEWKEYYIPQAWFTKRKIVGTVKATKFLSSRDGIIFSNSMRGLIGQTFIMRQCGNHWTLADGRYTWCVSGKWVKPGVIDRYVKAVVKDIPAGTRVGEFYFLEVMRKYVGQVITLKKSFGKLTYRGWVFSPKWLDFEVSNDG